MNTNEAKLLQAQLDRLETAVIDRNAPEIAMVARKTMYEPYDVTFGGKGNGG